MPNSKLALDSANLTFLNAVGWAAGFASIALVAALFGASWETDAFFLALAIPTFVSNALVNVVTSVFLPVVTDYRVNDPMQAGRVVGSVLLYIVGFSLVSMLVLALGMPVVLPSVARGLTNEGQGLASSFTLVLVPLVAILAGSSVLAAVFNSEGVFQVPAWSTIARYVVTGVLLVVLKGKLGSMALPVSFLLGPVAQAAVLLGSWRMLTLHIVPTWRADKRLLPLWKLAAPWVLGALAIQFIPVFGRFLALTLPEGSVSIFDYANRVTVGVMELITSGVMLVTLSDWSELAARSDWMLLGLKLRRLMLTLLFLVLPLVGALALVRVPLVAVAFQRGQFDTTMTRATAGVLFFFFLGMPVDLVGRLFLRLFLVHQDTVPLGVSSIAMLVVYALVSVPLIRLVDVRGLAIAYDLALVSLMVLLAALGRSMIGSALRGIERPILRLCLATLGAVAIGALVDRGLEGYTFLLRVPAVVVSLTASYAILAAAMRIQELDTVTRLARDWSNGRLRRWRGT